MNNDKFVTIFSFSLFILLMIDTIKHKRYQPLINDLKDPYTAFVIIYILVFSVIMMNFNILRINKKNYEKMKKITSEAFFGFIIAVCARLDMCFLPFYLIFIIGYISVFKINILDIRRVFH